MTFATRQDVNSVLGRDQVISLPKLSEGDGSISFLYRLGAIDLTAHAERRAGRLPLVWIVGQPWLHFEEWRRSRVMPLRVGLMMFYPFFPTQTQLAVFH